MRASIKSMGMPQGFPMLGGLDEKPEMATDWRRIGGMHNATDKDLEDFLPSALCKGGLCKGALPGCSQAQAKMMTFPKIIINLNRTMTWDKIQAALKSKKSMLFGFGGSMVLKTMRPALAYAFATLPEMVEMGVKETENYHAQKLQLASMSTTPHVGFWSGGNQADAGKVQITTPAPYNYNWFNNERRLDQIWHAPIQHPVGSHEVLPDQLGDRQVSLTFKRGLPFVVDRPLLNMMLQNGYFQDLRDETGPLEIVGFHIESGHPVEVDDEGRPIGGDTATIRGFSSGLSVFGCAALACSLLTASAVLLRRRWSVKGHSEGYLAQGYSSEGLE